MKKIKQEFISNNLLQLLENLPSPQQSNGSLDKIIRNSAVKSSSISAALSIPGGALGVVSAIPDILTVWKIQSQMIANIAAHYEKEALLGQEQMIWCMFRQIAVGIGKEVVVQEGTKFLVKKANEKLLYTLAGRIGYGIMKQQSGKIISKAVPLIGSLSAGAITYYDTLRVGKNAARLYSSEIELVS